MEQRRAHIFWIGVACLLLAWGLLFVRYVLAVEALRHPLWLPLILTFAAGGLTGVSGVSRRARAVVATAVVLIAVALALLHTVGGDPKAVATQWRHHATGRVIETLVAVGREVVDLERVSTGIGERVVTAVDAGEVDLSGGRRTAGFELLDSLAADVTRGGVLPPGTQIGIQLFDRDGKRVAWAGWPQAVSPIEQVFFSSGKELVYSRKVTLYQILSHIIPVTDRKGRHVGSVLVDLPLEVNFRVNNRFLKSASLADNISTAGVSTVTFDYFPTLASLPERLHRFEFAREQAGQRHRRRLERLHAASEARNDTLVAVMREDSALSFTELPEHVEVMNEINGDPSVGLSGRVMVSSPQGNPVLAVTVTSHPLGHYVEQRETRALLWARGVIVLTLVLLFTLLLARMRVADSLANRWAGAALFTILMVVLRYSLLSLRTVSPSSQLKLFDPTVFATPALGGIMRSAGDLLITSVFLVTLLYGLSRIVRAGDRDTREPRAGGSVSIVRLGVKTAVMVVAALAVFALARWFTATVVVNANPRLLGETMNITDPQVLVLHLSLFLALIGFLLAGAFGSWAVFRWTGAGGSSRALVVALVVLAGISAKTHQWELSLVSVPLLLFIAYAPLVARREDLVSFVLVSFYLVVVASGTAYTFLTRNYDELRQSFVVEKSGEMLDPSDNWKVVILEDVLSEYAGRHDIRQAVRSPQTLDVQRLAFDLWAEGPLSLLGYSCAIHVITAEDEVISDFSVDMPYRARITEGGERIDTPSEEDWVVLDLTRSTPRGIVRFYRGILNIQDARMTGTHMSRQVIGKVIIDLPFFFESLRLAARTGPRTPEVLRNVQEGGVAPRVEEPEALLLARLDGRQIFESSSDRVALGQFIDEDLFERGLERKWPLLRAGDRNYRFLIRETDTEGQYLLAGFVVPTPERHVIRWSTLLSLYLLYTVVMIVTVILCSGIPYIKRVLPTLTPGGKLGFQQKLLASFLVVALVPAIILGAFAVGFIKERFVEETRKEAVYKAFSARKAFVNLLHGELQFILNRDDTRSLFKPGGPRMVRLGEGRVAMLFDDLSAGGFAAAADSTPSLGVMGGLEDPSVDDLFVVRSADTTYLAVVSAPLRVSEAGWSESYYVGYGRRVDAGLLGEVADQIAADVNVYDDGELVASSREGLLAGGFISAIMNSHAYINVAMLGSDHSLATEKAGRYSYQVAYLPVNRWQFSPDRSSVTTAPVQAAMSVPLVFRPESYYLEVQKATSILLGIFTLLFAATVALGLFLARGIFEPLRGLVAGTLRISQGDYDVRLPARRTDEIGTVVTAFNEMTERVAESQRVLEERRRYLETILESIGTGVISTDGDDRVRAVNSAAERILGISTPDVLGRPLSELTAEHPEQKIYKLLTEGRNMSKAFVSGEIELRREKRSATVKYMLTQLRVEDRYLGTVFVFEDLTELIQSKKLSAWVEMARQIAHEIKNPLTPIRISTQFMQRAYETRPEQFEKVFKESTETILHQVDVLKRIASEFSSYGRMQQLEVGTHPLDPLVQNIIAPYMKNDAGVNVHYHDGTPQARVLIDPEAFRKICTNLVENAMEAMPEGGDLHVSCREFQLNGDRYVGVSFRDTGAGLSPDVAGKLFEPYFSTKTTGTGLGLAICRTLSQEMGGDVTVENLPDGSGVEAILTVRVSES